MEITKLDFLNDQEKSIASLIQRKGPVTKSEIIDILKLKLSTLNRIIESLVDKKIIMNSSIGESTGGRKPVLYDMNPYYYHTIGIDISRLYVHLAVANLKMDIVDEYSFRLPPTPESTVEAASMYIDSALKRLYIDKFRVLGVGVGTVGPLDRNKGTMLNPKDFPEGDWTNIPIRDMLEQKLKLPVVVENGANAAVLAEYLFGSGRGFGNIAYFNCGMGIRTGVISSGNIVRSINDAEDAFGHMVIDVYGEPCSCGGRGCIECYCSIPAIERKFLSGIKKGLPSSVNKPLEDINYVDICNAAEGNDQLSRSVIISAAEIFGTGLSNCINLLDPKLVILSGPLINQSPLFYEISTHTALKSKYQKGAESVIFNKGGYFLNNSIAIGAAAEVIEAALKTKKTGGR